MKTVNVLLRFVIAASAAFAAAGAQDTAAAPSRVAQSVPRYRFRVLGVFDATSGDPIEGVEVIDLSSGTKAVTTASGTVSLFFLPDGGSLVRVRKVGYGVQTLPVAISPADTAPITLVLERATALPAVIVKDSVPSAIGLRGFEERRREGFGHFVTEAQFRKDDGKPLSNVLIAQIPGIMTSPGPHAETYIVSSRKPCSGNTFLNKCRTPDCYVSIYQDGATIYDASTPGATIPDMARLSATDYAAAEYYAGGATLPPGFNATSSGCGTLLLWTRVR